MNYSPRGSALIFVIMITSTCALYLRCVIRNASYSVQYARMRTEHIHNEYLLSGFKTLAVSWIADNYDTMVKTIKEGNQERIEFTWPLNKKYHACVYITKKNHCFIITVKRGLASSIECSMCRETTGNKQFRITCHMV